jgi:hypothetical protein
MSLFESRDQQVGFVRKIVSAPGVALIQRPPRLLQEGLGLVEGVPLAIGERTMFKVGDALRQTFLSGLDLVAKVRPSLALGGLDRWRFDR